MSLTECPLNTESGRSGRSKDRQLSTLTGQSAYMNGPSRERCLQIIINPTQILTEWPSSDHTPPLSFPQ